MNVILETDRLYLREFTENDYEDLCEILQDKEAMYAYQHAFSDEEVKNWYEKLISGHYQKYGFGMWAVIHKEFPLQNGGVQGWLNGELLGQCGLIMQENEGKEILEIGYLFKKKHWKKGYATEAAKACRDYTFEVLKVENVYSIIRDSNTASQNVALRIGMKKVSETMKRYYDMDMLHYVYEIKKDPGL